MTFQLRHPSSVELKSVPVSVANSGDNTIVAAVDGRRIKVVAYTIQATGTVNAKWKDGANVDLTGAFNFQAREGITADAISVVGSVTYFDDDAS